MRNIKLLLTYDGTNYLGWQKTRMGPSIEETLQIALEQILQHKICLQAASRTDAGVHADGQVVNFFTEKHTSIKKLHHSLNSLLPKDIVVVDITQENLDFHPTLDAHEKEYRYFVCVHPIQSPQKRLYSWHYPYVVDISLMKKAAKQLIGIHNFAAFCNAKKNEKYSSTFREVSTIKIEETNDKMLCFTVRGTNFLYKMVRNIVGTLIYVGCGKLSADAISNILKGLDRTQGGVTAPAHGLTLHKVIYNKKNLGSLL